jgi:hypothetical protein
LCIVKSLRRLTLRKVKVHGLIPAIPAISRFQAATLIYLECWDAYIWSNGG